MSDGAQDILPDYSDGQLGRHIWHDPKNRLHPARGAVFSEGEPIVTKVWKVAHVWDQGRTSSCTMQAATGLLHSEPFSSKVGAKTLRAYNQAAERYNGYRRSQQYDPWPGVNYEGTSTDAPLKLLRAERRISGWRWCFGLTDVLSTLSNWGPVTIGVNWHHAMFTPDANGYIHSGGMIVGGHCVELYGVNVEKNHVLGVNSWGSRWGPLRGHFKIDTEMLGTLLSDNGEAATVIP